MVVNWAFKLNSCFNNEKPLLLAASFGKGKVFSKTRKLKIHTKPDCCPQRIKAKTPVPFSLTQMNKSITTVPHISFLDFSFSCLIYTHELLSPDENHLVFSWVLSAL